MRTIHACVIFCCVVLICQKTQSAIDDVFRQLDEAAAEAPIEQQNTGWCNYKMKDSRKTLVKIQHDMILERDTYDQVFSKSNDSEEELNSCLAQSSDKEKYKSDDDNQYRNVANYVFRSKRYAAKEDKRWPRKIIHYNISGFDHKGRENILEAMRVWSKFTCLKFTERAHEFDYIDIVPSDECYSSVGCRRGPQFISLNNNSCMDIPIILHELGHAIGLYHEHSRPDRDKFVFVHYNNITKNMSHEFDKIDPREYVNFNKPYDYRSIMHYSKRAFAANPNGITLETIDEDYADIIGKATVLSFYDVMLVNAMYNCSEDCTNKTCPDKGFLTESCDCYCPSNSTNETWTKCPGDYCQPPNIDFLVDTVYPKSKDRILEEEEISNTKYKTGDVLIVENNRSEVNRIYTCKDGQWISNLVPRCPTITLDNGTVTYFGNREVYTLAFFSCSDNFDLSSVTNTECEKNQQWVEIPKCIPRLTPWTPANGFTNTNTLVKNGERYNANCINGFLFANTLTDAFLDGAVESLQVKNELGKFKLIAYHNIEYTTLKCRDARLTPWEPVNGVTNTTKLVKNGQRYNAKCDKGFLFANKLTDAFLDGAVESLQVKNELGKFKLIAYHNIEYTTLECRDARLKPWAPVNGSTNTKTLVKNGKSYNANCDKGFLFANNLTDAFLDGAVESMKIKNELGKFKLIAGHNIEYTTLECRDVRKEPWGPYNGYADTSRLVHHGQGYNAICYDDFLFFDIKRTKYFNKFGASSLRVVNELGVLKIKVSSNKYISTNDLTCKDARCKAPTVENGKLVAEGYWESDYKGNYMKNGSKVLIKCNDGYELFNETSGLLLKSNNNSITCELGKILPDTISRCIIQCPRPTMTNAVIEPEKDMFSHKEEINVACKDGYDLEYDFYGFNPYEYAVYDNIDNAITTINKIFTCNNGTFDIKHKCELNQDTPVHAKDVCQLPSVLETQLTLYDLKERTFINATTERDINNGTSLEFNCKPVENSYYEPNRRVFECVGGSWVEKSKKGGEWSFENNGSFPKCRPVKCPENCCTLLSYCVRDFQCNCRNNKTCPPCEQPVCSGGCLNGGSCIASDNCTCPDGYEGTNCQKAVCNGSCLHGGRCIAPGTCTCTDGYKGERCEQEDPCKLIANGYITDSGRSVLCDINYSLVFKNNEMDASLYSRYSCTCNKTSGTFRCLGSNVECKPKDPCKLIANGNITDRGRSVVCDSNYSLVFKNNEMDASLYSRYSCTCNKTSGTFRCLGSNVDCKPNGCLFPKNFEQGLTLYDSKENQYVIRTNRDRILHGGELIFNCAPSGNQYFEPSNRTFVCNKGSWVGWVGQHLAGEEPWSFGTFPKCRPAACSQGCQNGGTCTKHNQCTCKAGIYGYSCEFEKPCQYKGVSYQSGQTFKDDCNDCKCRKGAVECSTRGCPKKPCQFKGLTFQSGETFKDDCNDCKCLDGAVECTQRGCPKKLCQYKGVTYQSGQPFKDDCNDCTCWDGDVRCTKQVCPKKPCQYKGLTFQSGETFKDDCNDCKCLDGAVECTQRGCPRKLCQYKGVTYQSGQPFKDDCNDCTCWDGDVRCTKQVCPKKLCQYKGVSYQSGQIFKDDCNDCKCCKGAVECSKRDCPIVCSQGCQNGGNCTEPNKCTCKEGFYGSSCEFSGCAKPEGNLFNLEKQLYGEGDIIKISQSNCESGSLPSSGDITISCNHGRWSKEIYCVQATNYSIRVVTADKLGAGTDGNVTIRLQGTKGETGNIGLLGNFERKTVDDSYNFLPDVGTIKSITIGVTRLNFLNDGWIPSHVTVRDTRLNQFYLFQHDETELDNRSITLALKECVTTYTVKRGYLTGGKGPYYKYRYKINTVFECMMFCSEYNCVQAEYLEPKKYCGINTSTTRLVIERKDDVMHMLTRQCVIM